MPKRVLVVDDDHLLREMVRDVLVEDGFRVELAASGPEALERLAEPTRFDVVVTDLSMREMDGLDLLGRIKRAHPKLDVIIMTAYASLESALQAMRLGAADYLRKPVKPPEILYGVKRIVLRRQMLEENEFLRSHVQAFEASRVLTSCLESADVLPLTLDLVLRLTDRQRAVGRLLRDSPRLSDGICLRGFPDELATRLRQTIEEGKLFLPSDLEPGSEGGEDAWQEVLAEFGIDDRLLALPLRLEERIVGGIWLFSEGRPFEGEEIRRAELVVEQGELALMNAERFLQAREKAFIDDVTDLYNARYLLAALDREVSRAARGGLDLSVLFLDLDRFKDVNDSYGHLIGSRVLRELGQLFHHSVRSIDTVARYGGDEFTILLVDTGFEGAWQVAERIRETVAKTPFGAERGLQLRLTVSIGVASFGLHGEDRERLLDHSDKAMYLAKSLGRNRVCSAGELPQAARSPL